MYIRRANIYGFGNLIDQQLTFDPKLTVIFGNNEAGKSTLLAFITSMLFGFATKKQPYEQYIPRKSNRYGGELKLITGNDTYLIRRTEGKSGGKLETFQNDQQVDNQVFQQLLGTIDRKLYNDLFYFDTASMLVMSALNKQTLIQQILTIGAVNSGDWLDQAQSFEKQARILYKPSGRKPVINQLIDQYQQLNAAIGKEKGNLPRYLNLQKQSDQLQQKLNELNEQLNQVNQQQQHLQHLKQIWPSFQQYQTLGRTTLNMPDAQKIQQVADTYQQLQTKIDYQTQAIEKRRTENLADLDSNNFYVKHAEAFQTISQQLPYVQTIVSKQRLLDQRIAQTNSHLEDMRSQNPNVTREMTPLSGEDFSVVSQYSAQLKTQQGQLEQLHQSELDLQVQENQLTRELNDIQPTQTATSFAENSKFLNGLAIVGGMIALIGLFMPSFVKLLTIVGLAIIALSLYQKRLVTARNTVDSNEGQSQQQILTNQLHEVQQKRHDTAQSRQQIQDKIDAIHNALSLLKQKYNLSDNTDLLQLQPTLTTIEQIEQELERLQNEHKDNQTKLIQFDDQTEFLQDKLGQYPTFSDDYFETLKHELKIFETYLRQNEQDTIKAEQLQSWLKEQKVELADLRWQQQQLLQSVHFKDFEALQSALQKVSNTKNDLERHAFLKQQLGEALPELQNFATEEQLDAQITQIKAQHTEQVKQQQDWNQQLKDTEVAIANLATGDQLQTLEQQQENLQTELLTKIQAYLTDTLASQWIRKTLESASQDRFPKILTQATEFFKILTVNKYQQIIFESDHIFVQTGNQARFDVNELSLGTMEQLYLALRLAFTDQLSDLVNLPILLDDVLVNADNERLPQLVDLIKNLAQRHQIIFTTAHKELLTYFKNQQIIELHNS